MKHKTILALGVVGIVAASAYGQSSENPYGVFRPRSKTARYERDSFNARRAYSDAIRRTADMVNDSEAQRLAQLTGLNLVNLTWEDTGRYKNSSVGPNISDLTIEVEDPEGVAGQRRDWVPPTRLMPVFRFPNFSDITGDLDPASITLMVGNERGRSLKRIALDEYLENIERYLSKRDGEIVGSLLADRDQSVLASAQACFLPVPQRGKATFAPVLFNYQSSPKNPAVLSILATPEGTSASVIENNRESGNQWGQRLYFNNNGKRARLTGERMSDYQENTNWRDRGKHRDEPVDEAGLNMVMVIQVPLKNYRQERIADFAAGSPMPSATAESKRSRPSDVENAVIDHGFNEGPFSELNRNRIERDTRFPIRVTVQFYKATSNGVVNRADVQELKRDIDQVYQASDSVGSLVTQGRTGRITEYEGVKQQPRQWWDNFWRKHERTTGEGRYEAERRLRSLLRNDRYEEMPVCTLYLNDLLRRKN